MELCTGNVTLAAGGPAQQVRFLWLKGALCPWRGRQASRTQPLAVGFLSHVAAPGGPDVLR